MLLLNKNAKEIKLSIPISITYNRSLPKVKSIAERHYHILKVNLEFKEIFHAPSLITFRKNRNLY